MVQTPRAAITLGIVIAAFLALVVAVATTVLSWLAGNRWPVAVLHGGAAFGGTLTLGTLLIALYQSG
ncbi:hypothetical protein ACWGCI_14340 [Streptomyces sp. NPDC054949]|uniref:hypothetical protein n=1 Tax=unclassified Streptomyces TaxID=2593676 RepID=UPI0006ADA221|nr:MULTISPECIES: hypothetical protein [unclassified Streptomyces]KOU40190.1 hypothetical protein ADK55_32015 [Streptomyces sp. WM4235]MCX5077576.1 hypothetical protein [Streptomyces sp. NBC_00424]WUD39450.1 hypothetical protein OHA84_02545 [Streptomyces sp. NBC_00513]